MNMEQLVFSLVQTHSHTLSPNPLLAIILNIIIVLLAINISIAQ